MTYFTRVGYKTGIQSYRMEISKYCIPLIAIVKAFNGIQITALVCVIICIPIIFLQ